MDNRLDFFNYIKEYQTTLSDDDALLVLSHNKKDGDCITLLNGDWQILSALFNDGYVNFVNGNRKWLNDIKKSILNIAYNICEFDNKSKRKFLKALNSDVNNKDQSIEKNYRLEFNEIQQMFHLDDYSHVENSNGWFTIMDNCTDLYFRVFEAYVNRSPRKKLTKNYLLKCVNEFKHFVSNLSEYQINLTEK